MIIAQKGLGHLCFGEESGWSLKSCKQCHSGITYPNTNIKPERMKLGLTEICLANCVLFEWAKEVDCVLSGNKKNSFLKGAKIASKLLLFVYDWSRKWEYVFHLPAFIQSNPGKISRKINESEEILRIGSGQEHGFWSVSCFHFELCKCNTYSTKTIKIKKFS